MPERLETVPEAWHEIIRLDNRNQYDTTALDRDNNSKSIALFLGLLSESTISDIQLCDMKHSKYDNSRKKDDTFLYSFHINLKLAMSLFVLPT
jgi:hypothetical protein